jgi:hypothetical protein
LLCMQGWLKPLFRVVVWWLQGTCQANYLPFTHAHF